MATDRAYYSLPVDYSEWTDIQYAINHSKADPAGRREAVGFQGTINNLLDDPVQLRAEQLYELRPTEDNPTISDKPYALVYIYSFKGKLYASMTERKTQTGVPKEKRIYITLPETLLAKMSIGEAKKVYDIPEDISS